MNTSKYKLVSCNADKTIPRFYFSIKIQPRDGVCLSVFVSVGGLSTFLHFCWDHCDIINRGHPGILRTSLAAVQVF